MRYIYLYAIICLSCTGCSNKKSEVLKKENTNLMKKNSELVRSIDELRMQNANLAGALKLYKEKENKSFGVPKNKDYIKKGGVYDRVFGQ